MVWGKCSGIKGMGRPIGALSQEGDRSTLVPLIHSCRWSLRWNRRVACSEVSCVGKGLGQGYSRASRSRNQVSRNQTPPLGGRCPEDHPPAKETPPPRLLRTPPRPAARLQRKGRRGTARREDQKPRSPASSAAGHQKRIFAWASQLLPWPQRQITCPPPQPQPSAPFLLSTRYRCSRRRAPAPRHRPPWRRPITNAASRCFADFGP